MVGDTNFLRKYKEKNQNITKDKGKKGGKK